MSISPCEKDGTKWRNKSLQILDPHPLNAQPWGAIKAPPKDTTPLPTVAGRLQGSSWLGCTNSDKFTAAFLARIRKCQKVLRFLINFVTPASAKGLSTQVCKACHWVCGDCLEALISKKRFEMLQRGGRGDMNHTHQSHTNRESHTSVLHSFWKAALMSSACSLKALSRFEGREVIPGLFQYIPTDGARNGQRKAHTCKKKKAGLQRDWEKIVFCEHV